MENCALVQNKKAEAKEGSWAVQFATTSANNSDLRNGSGAAAAVTMAGTNCQRGVVDEK
jgi:hypothetical protein